MPRPLEFGVLFFRTQRCYRQSQIEWTRIYGNRVRAEIGASSVTSLARSDVISAARSVTDPGNFRVVVAVRIDNPTPDDLAAAEALGANVTSNFTPP